MPVIISLSSIFSYGFGVINQIAYSPKDLATMSISVMRTGQSLVGPCEPTPSEMLYLSIIDRVPGLRHMVRSLHVFKHGQEPAKVVREAVSMAPVKYYPFARWFIDSMHCDDVRIACTGKGAWFVEATANCCLEEVPRSPANHLSR